jgi:hypothetical protein
MIAVANISDCADFHVAMWAIAWEMANLVDLSGRPDEEKISIRVNLVVQVYNALDGKLGTTSERIKQVLEIKPT